MNPDGLAARVRAGDVRAAAGLMRALEHALDAGVPDAEATAALRLLYPHSGAAFVVGITGPPGAGKSSLVDALITRCRARGERVGVVAVDPSSPFSGGAVLGDRIRMQRHALDDGVFIRSLATRGQLGGLARAAADVVTVLGALGCAIIFVETVGVGQDEVDIAGLADVVAVVLVPGLGDDVQAIKAGLLEIADLFVVNKADREGADQVVADLTNMLALAPREDPLPPILSTVAPAGRGLDELVAALDRARERVRAGSANARRRHQAAVRLRALVQDRLRREAERLIAAGGRFETLVGEVAAHRLAPEDAVDALLGAAPSSR